MDFLLLLCCPFYPFYLSNLKKTITMCMYLPDSRVPCTVYVQMKFVERPSLFQTESQSTCTKRNHVCGSVPSTEINGGNIPGRGVVQRHRNSCTQNRLFGNDPLSMGATEPFSMGLEQNPH